MASIRVTGENRTQLAEVFRERFLRKYFPEDVRGKKEIEFLEVKQGNRSVTEYAAKCFRCGQAGHRIHECTSTEKKCYKCGKGGHLAAECR